MSQNCRHPLTILLMEDHVDTRSLLRRSLERSGHTVHIAGSVVEARAVFARTHAQVLISDIGLPDGDGWELLSEIRLTAPVTAIAISGYGSTDDHKRSQVAGFHSHLVKPFKTKELSVLLDGIGEKLFEHAA